MYQMEWHAFVQAVNISGHSASETITESICLNNIFGIRR
jgi:hypothetical protein